MTAARKAPTASPRLGATARQLDTAPGLYLHLPFCSAICPYCDFSVLTGTRAHRRRFVEDLVREIRLAAEDPWPAIALPPDRPFDTVYIGGGTPSLIEPEDLERLLAELRHLPVAPDAWIYLEANPEDVSPARVTAWQRLGVSTVNLGAQSFDDRNLRFLGRLHTAAEARRATELLQQAGLATLSVDLIYGLPGQTAEQWRRDLEEAVHLAPDHLSCYQLTFHDKTPFGFRLARGQMAELPEGVQAQLFRLTHELLNDAGYQGYEVSNFAASPEHQSRHSWKYWGHVPYLGLGPSAHSFAGRRRWWNVRKIRPWEALVRQSRRPVAESEELTDEQIRLERLMLGLRTYEGVELDLLAGPPSPGEGLSNGRLIEQLEEAGLLVRDNGRLRPTLAGLTLADGLAAALAPLP